MCVCLYACVCACALKLGITNKKEEKMRLRGREERVQESVHWNGASNRYRSGQAGVVVRKKQERWKGAGDDENGRRGEVGG